jgi:Flp pilus assembly protein TadG
METESMRSHGARLHERGQVIPIVGLMLVILIAAAALAVDVGYWRYQQRLAQSAADSAAIAGTAEIMYPASNDVTPAAQADAASNGFTDGVASTVVKVNQGANISTGPNQGNNNAVEVIITRQMPLFFSNILGPTFSTQVRARAVAKLSSTGGGCIYVMKGSISGDLTLNGGGRGGITTSPLCGVVVNDNLSVTGQANVDASFISYAGSGPSGGSYPHAQPQKGVPASDPCVRLPGCAYLLTLPTTNPGLFSATCMDTAPGVLPPNPIPQGRYCYGPYSGVTVTMASGLFIMDKGWFDGTSSVSGTGVTVYNNCTSNCNTTLNGGQVTNSIVAPTTGATAGIAYFQPPGLINNITVNGAAGTVQQMGGVYAPGASFTFNGQLPTLSFLVAGQIIMNGGGLTAGSTLGGQPQPTNAVLAE